MPPILVRFSGKCIAKKKKKKKKKIVIAKLIERKNFILRRFVSDLIGPSKKLFVQIYQMKHKNKV